MNEELKWGCEPGDFADQEAMRRTIADRQWISASEARDMVSQGWHGEGKPTDAIIFRAKHGEVLAKVRRWVWIETDHEGNEKFEWNEKLIPRGFWDDNDIDQNWSQGDFRSVIYPDDGKKYDHTLIDVMFERTSIELMAAKSASANVAPSMIVQSTANAERECQEWLQQQFVADPEKRRKKASFEVAALMQFAGRLSQAGFRRVWAKVAPSDDRNKPGRKS
jgi:hypothetical protein